MHDFISCLTNTFTIATIVISCIAAAVTSSTAASSVVAAAVGSTTVVKSIAAVEMNALKAVVRKSLSGIGTCYYFDPFSSSRPNVKRGFSCATPSFFCEYQNKAYSCTL